jgi:hypothetical protein
MLLQLVVQDNSPNIQSQILLTTDGADDQTKTLLLIPSTLTEYSPSLLSESIGACHLRLSLYFNFGTMTTLRGNGDKKTDQSRAQKPPLHSSTGQAQTTEARTGDIPNKHNRSFFAVPLYTYFGKQYPPTVLHSVICFVPFVDLLCLASDLHDPVQLLARLWFLRHVQSQKYSVEVANRLPITGQWRILFIWRWTD